MNGDCAACGGPIDPEAWPIVVVTGGEARLLCSVACHDRWAAMVDAGTTQTR